MKRMWGASVEQFDCSVNICVIELLLEGGEGLVLVRSKIVETAC
jgi:hypothetical protein